MTKYELVGKIMGLGAENSGKSPNLKMMAKNDAVKLLDEYLSLNISNINNSLIFDDKIQEFADEWVFDKNSMKWSNNDDTAGDNYGSFIAGAKWALNQLNNEL